MLGKIENVPLRKIWKNEAYDFTPWLAENLEELGKAVGLELEFEEMEAAVGPYSADILAKDSGSGQYVVIENQLEKTNHDHLGKCITYASVLNASAIIWVAAEFTDEHQKALDWLNDHTSDDISFFGVKLELWQIDNSNPAIQFNVKSEPNEIVRQTHRRKEQSELSEVKKVQLSFWLKFKEELLTRESIRSLQTPRPQYWFDVALGMTGINISNTFNTWEKKIGVRIYIGNKNAEEWLPYFESKKEIIEEKLGHSLEWNPNPGNRDKVIVLTKDFDYENEGNWDATIKWLANETIKFRILFKRLISEKRK